MFLNTQKLDPISCAICCVLKSKLYALINVRIDPVYKFTKEDTQVKNHMSVTYAISNLLIVEITKIISEDIIIKEITNAMF